jgi:hypothetical protein
MSAPKSRFPRRREFSEPILVKASDNDPNRIDKILNERLDLLCEVFGIKERGSKRYRQLSLTVLQRFTKLRGFQVVTSLPKRKGAPVKWTLQRHFELVELIQSLMIAGKTSKQAFGLAKKEFRVKTDASIKAQYHRANRFFKKAPRIAGAMRSMRPESELAKFFSGGASIETSYGLQRVTHNRIGKVVPNPTKSARPK